jgi:hypothetical protein
LSLYAPEVLEQLDFGDFDPNATAEPEGEAPATDQGGDITAPEAPAAEVPAEEPVPQESANGPDNEPDEKDDDPPFDPDEKPSKPVTPGKHGQGYSQAKHLAQQGMKKAMNVQEVAEFIHSFYDPRSGTFPKSPEGVATMVGKKFGPKAEAVARKMVERMAPQQQDPQIAELARIRELAGY